MAKLEYTTEELLESYPPPIRELAHRLRNLVLTSGSNISEKANKGWRSISFHDPFVGYFCGIFPFEDHVDLIFEFGALLADPAGILKGDAKQVRYIRFRNIDEIHEEPIVSLIGDALSLPANHSVRRGLTQSKARRRIETSDECSG